MVYKLRTIINMDVSNREARLCLSEVTKVGNMCVNFRIMCERESPTKVREIIQHDKVVVETRNVRNW